MPNGPKSALAIVAVACSAVSIPLNPRQTLREIEVCFAVLRPDAVFLVRGADSIVRRVAERRGITIIEAVQPEDGFLNFTIAEMQSANARALDEDDEPDPNAPAFILQTSGTTSAPKFIPTSHKNMLAAAARVRNWFDLTPQDRCLSASPIFYAHGLHVTVFAPILSGGTIAFPKDAFSFDYVEWFETLKPTWYSAGPTLHRLVFDHIKSDADDAKMGHSLRFVLSGGAPLPRDVKEGLQKALKVPVVEHYGSSEGLQICSNQLQSGRSKPETCGIPSPDTIVIVDDNGRRLPPGQQGEILVGGPTVVSGYLNAPELNKAHFVNGWFKTGDIGSIDDDGFLSLHGRKNDLINRGGEKISPAEIDDILLCHPAVAEAAAFSVPHARLGEDVVAAVVLHSGATVSPEELRKYLRDQLASFKVPGKIFVRDKLPKGKTGKVIRRELSESLGSEIVVEKPNTSQSANESIPASGTLVVQLIELWERLLQTKSLTPDDDFSEKGGDSLLAMEMLSEVERLTGQTIPTSILFEARTIRQLTQKLYSLDIRPKPITVLNPDGRLVPLILFHGDYLGGGLYAARLAGLLGTDRPLAVIAPHDIEQEALPRSIEEIASDGLALVLKAQAKGPYRLCGYCLGGIFAFEVARLLMATGEKVEFVGMIDSPTVNARRLVQRPLLAMRCVRPMFGPIVDRAVARAWYISSQLDRPLSNFKAWLKKIVRWRSDERSSSVFAMSVYSPKPIAVPVIYFAAEYGARAWRRLCSDLSVIEMDADHFNVVRDPANLGKIAEYLNSWCSSRK
jgi:acyl-CoA synthetase (AMP-forming)/AMP-acid ligase II/thioesterase domain-containing protein/acyl carrier protein